MAVPAAADETITPSATVSVTHPVPTQAQPVTAGMPASSIPEAETAALSSHTPSEQSQLAHASTALPMAAATSADTAKPPAPIDTAGEEQRESIPSGDAPLRPGIMRSTSDAMDTS